MITWPWLLLPLVADSWNDGFGLSLLTVASDDLRGTLAVGAPWASRSESDTKGALVLITLGKTEPGTSRLPLDEGSSKASMPSASVTTRVAGEVGFGTRLIPVGDLDADGAPEILVRHTAGLAVVSAKTPKVLFDIPYGRALDAACGWIDVSRDGVPDVFVSGANPSTASSNSSLVRAFSGKDGSSIDDVTIPVGDGGGIATMVRIPDVDGDHVDELAIGWAFDSGSLRSSMTPGRVDIVSSHDRHVVRTIAGDTSGSAFGASIASIADLDEDGIDDLVIGAPGPAGPEAEAGATSGRVVLVSAKTGKRLRTIEGEHGPYDQFGNAIAVSDPRHGPVLLAVGARGAGRVEVIRPSSGEVVCSISRGPMTDFGTQVAFVPDEDDDGRSDVAISAVRDLFYARGSGAVFICSTRDGHVLRTLSNATK